MADAAAAFVEDLSGERGPLSRDSLDYSRASLQHVDRLLDRFHREGSPLPSALHNLVAAYVFEVLRREFGGRYVAGDEANPFVLVIGEPDFQLGVMVMGKIRGRVTNGPEDDLVFFTDGIPPLVAQRRSATLV